MGTVDGLSAYKKLPSKEYQDNYEKIFGKKKPLGVSEEEAEKIRNEKLKLSNNTKVDNRIFIKGGEGTQEEQRRYFRNDILQPYDPISGKVNGDYVKVYGEEALKKADKFREQLRNSQK